MTRLWQQGKEENKREGVRNTLCKPFHCQSVTGNLNPLLQISAVLVARAMFELEFLGTVTSHSDINK